MKTRIVHISDAQVQSLVALHLEGMRGNSPAGHVFALDDTGLADPTMTLFGTWEDGTLLGIGALKKLSPQLAEVKSMRVRPEHIGRGIGKAILEAIITHAVDSGFETLSLETGSGEAFEAAIGLYRKRGFESGEAFGDYVASDFNQFFNLDLGTAKRTSLA